MFAQSAESVVANAICVESLNKLYLNEIQYMLLILLDGQQGEIMKVKLQIVMTALNTR